MFNNGGVVTDKVNTGRLTRIGVLIALSAVGAGIKIPSILGTPALDSAPGYFAALAFGLGDGALVIGLGHLITGLTAGFPLTLPLHLLIALGMATCATAVAWTSRVTNRWLAVVVGVILNGIALPALFILIPAFGWPFFSAMVLPLCIASLVNITLAVIAHEVLVSTGLLRR